MAKVLGRLIIFQKNQGSWKGIKIAEGMDHPVTHQQFANDTLLCGQSSLQEAGVIRRTIDTFCRATGQHVYWAKSEVMFFNTGGSRQQEITNILRVKMGTLPRKFLGTPLFGGPNCTDLWNSLIDSCVNHLEGWKIKWFTLAR